MSMSIDIHYSWTKKRACLQNIKLCQQEKEKWHRNTTSWLVIGRWLTDGLWNVQCNQHGNKDGEKGKLYMFDEKNITSDWLRHSKQAFILQRCCICFNYFVTFNLSSAIGDINTQQQKRRRGCTDNSRWFYCQSSEEGTVSFLLSPPPSPPCLPHNTILQVDKPAAWPAVCWCRRFKQRGLISISVCVNTLITHLSNEAAVSQPFSCMGIMVCVCVCVCVCVLRGRNVRDEGSLR